MFRSSSDRKVAPYGRRRGKSPNGMSPLKNSFGLPAGKDYSCDGATEWCHLGYFHQLQDNQLL